MALWRKKTLKNVDSAQKTRFLSVFLRAFACLAPLGLLISGLKGLIIAIAASAAAVVIVEVIVGFTGSGSVNLLYGFGRKTASLRDQLAADMNNARHHKLHKRYDRALLAVDNVLAKDGNFPEAQFLKAQILWEGFEDLYGAKEILLKVLKADIGDDVHIRQWAQTLYRELAQIEHGHKSDLM